MISFLFALLANLQACTLTTPGVIKVGCTIDCGDSYKTALQNAAREQGYRIEIQTIAPGGDPARSLAAFDGFLSPGGHDIDPQYFSKRVSPQEQQRLRALHQRFGNDGQVNPEHAQRDSHEYKLMTEYFKNPALANMPLLGICYGMQMMAAANDVPLYVDITEELGVPAQRRVSNQIRFTSMEKGD